MEVGIVGQSICIFTSTEECTKFHAQVATSFIFSDVTIIQLVPLALHRRHGRFANDISFKKEAQLKKSKPKHCKQFDRLSA